ncbi:MAG: zinc ribbon domain-containing protein [Chloroflexi bacterium]|nr:MAG: zinc ribbon domain-containing protein [Chloroflexota bacterium]
MDAVLCRDCGAANSQTTKFCVECGTPMATREAPPAEPVLCERCGASNARTTKFCVECGAPMAASASARPRRAAARAEPAAVAVAARPVAREDAPPLPPLPPVLAFFLEEQSGTRATYRTLAIGLTIFLLAFGGYFFSTHLHPGSGPSLHWIHPLSRYTFYADLAEALNHGSFDLRKAGIAPETHPDLLTKDGHVYLPYQPMPGVMLMPFVAIWGQGSTQITFSMLLGAVNVVVFWYILRLLGVSRETKLLLLPFFAFGTAHFYSASEGTLWFYNHVTALFFVQLALVFLLRRDSPVLPAIFLGLAALSRQPTVLAVPAFLYIMIEQRRLGFFDDVHPLEMVTSLVRGEMSRLGRLFGQVIDVIREALSDNRILSTVAIVVAVLVPFGIISLWYNAVRFDGIFDTGLGEIYDKYNGVAYTQYLAAGGAERFGQFDPRNIPIHIYTIFLQAPVFTNDPTMIRPSEFGMSILLTSSPFVYGALVKRRDPLKVACWIALVLVPIPTLMYYSGGWVQFGYRYLMDYLPFIMILTAFGFEDNRSPRSFRLKVALIVLSIAIGFWGRYWATRLGW